jgi:PAS domain S-box-containing protein
MMRNNGNKSEVEILHNIAKVLVKKKFVRTFSQLSETETLKLINELDVHQIELELQKEELISERLTSKAGAEKYIELYDFAPAGYFTISKEGNIVELNLSGSQILDKERYALINSRFQISPLKEYRDMLNETLDYLLCYNEPYMAEYKLRRADNGILRSVYSKGELEIVFDSDQVKVIGVVQDITEWKQTEEELDYTNERAEEDNRLMTESMYNISHEIRTPVSSPVGFSTKLCDTDFVLQPPEDFVFPVKKIILVAEDDVSSFRLIKYFLSRVNAEIIRAGNGKEAVEKSLSMDNIDLILMDLGMPVMDGYTAVRLIRKTNQILPIIAQTAYANDMKMAIDCGCNGFISKPYDQKHLINILGRFI